MPKFPFRIDLDEELAVGYPYDTSDAFTDNIAGRHFLFAGCSVTAGEALERPREDTWSYKVYTKLKDEFDNVGGYFNIAYSGATIGEQIDQIFKYCRKYGNPESIFFLMPNKDRDGDYLGKRATPDHLDLFIYRMYLHLDQYCKSNNIKLLSFTWAEDLDISELDDEIKPDDSYERSWARGHNTRYPNMPRPTWSQQTNGSNSTPSNILGSFDSYYAYSLDELQRGVFANHLKTKKYNRYTIMATDDLHQGTAYHDFWADFIYKKFKEIQNV